MGEVGAAQEVLGPTLCVEQEASWSTLFYTSDNKDYFWTKNNKNNKNRPILNCQMVSGHDTNRYSLLLALFTTPKQF